MEFFVAILFLLLLEVSSFAARFSLGALLVCDFGGLSKRCEEKNEIHTRKTNKHNPLV